MASKSSSLWRSLKCYQIYGANTDVGKTIMSTILCKAFRQRSPSETTWYLKPVSTGPLDEADDRHITRFAPQTKTRCLFQFDEAVSPHIAARSSKVSSAHLRKTYEIDRVTAPFRCRDSKTSSRPPHFLC
jgi:dethiobiotin synthetase/adenosylmethionine--8-amino-7-oxononanoate aminotransferase